VQNTPGAPFEILIDGKPRSYRDTKATSANALCGMVVRGGMTRNRCQIYFIDIFDIMRLLESVSERRESAYYTKTVSRRAASSATGASE